MIKVSVHPDKYPAVEEFFELFKTAWSRDDPDEKCTVLLSDGSSLSDSPAAVQILYSSDEQPADTYSSPACISDRGFCHVQLPDGDELPLYCASRRFHRVDDILIRETDSGDAVAYSEIRSGRKIIRVGYDLFDEVGHLLSAGQPLETAGTPTLDRHITFLRQSILAAGLPVVEIPPSPAGYDYMVCLTHDVDFVSIRNHGLDRTICGFIYRAVFGSVQRLFKRRLTLCQVLTNWWAVLSLPLVHAGIRKDYWMRFESYRQIEGERRSTFFLLPFRDRPGVDVVTAHSERRAARYELEEILKETAAMQGEGWEFGLHGIDAWHDADSGCQEKDRLASILGEPCAGVRSHWLCRNEESEHLLDTAGFEYDSTSGYNETIGFRAGTSQVFKPLNAKRLLEIPLHLQDVALFYPAFLDLDESAAWQRCMDLMDHQNTHGGVVTVLWHMRSLAPERLWGGFYERLLDEFSRTRAWVGTARETAAWFRTRRRTKLSIETAPDGQCSVQIDNGNKSDRGRFSIRVTRPGPQPYAAQVSFIDIPWDGHPKMKIDVGHATDFNRRRGQEVLV